jgi:protein-glutamine gamma-glutamyltransferase
MKIPIFYTGACLLFWGFESGNLLVSLLIAALLESSHFIKRKWHLRVEDFIRISDFTSVIFLASLALILLNYETLHFLKVVIRWQPLTVLPLILAQLFSTNDTIIIGTKFGGSKKEPYTHKPMEFNTIYCGLCLFSAAVTNSRSDLFFPLFVCLIGWILFYNRGKAFSIPLFFALFLLTTGLGYVGYQGGEKTHDYLSIKVGRMIRGYYWKNLEDPYQAYLSFGTLKNDKLSGKILLRMESKEKRSLLLRQASYDTYVQNRWINKKPFDYLPVSDKGWKLLPNPEGKGKTVQIELYLPREKGLLPSPKGSYLVSGEHLFELSHNSAGIVKILDAASLVTYDISFNEKLQSEQDIPKPINLKTPADEDYSLDQITEVLGLKDMPPTEQVNALKSFFNSNFTYSLIINRRHNSPTYLGDFLLNYRQGYCEMFATATTLLLRKAGTPSRYVTGFAAMEYSELEDKFIIRQRHAHAWTEAYINGKWVTVDTTPANWPEGDKQQSSFFEPLQDLYAYLKLQYDRFRIQAEQRHNLLLSAIIILLTTFLGWRYYRRLQAKADIQNSTIAHKTFDQETPFLLIEQRLQETGIQRGTSEPFFNWLTRINEKHNLDVDQLLSLHSLHQKLRFDPLMPSEKEVQQLQAGVNSWLEKFHLTSGNHDTSHITQRT